MISQAQSEVKDQLLQIAKNERDKFTARVKAMDDWLMSKKLEEAERVAHLRDLDGKDEIAALAKDNLNSFKSFIRTQTVKKQLTKKHAGNRNAKRMDDMARELAHREME